MKVTKEKSSKKKLSAAVKVLIALPVLLLIVFGTTVFARYKTFSKLQEPDSLDAGAKADLFYMLRETYPAEYQIIKPLPYSLGEHNLNLGAESAILIDVTTGNIIYEKNADEVIPPASMTKLFAMYVVDEAVSSGELSYDQVIPLPKESWACNMPPHSSLMFLGEGQVVTLEELLLGLSICSGNDAAYALAYTVSGTMEKFVEQMNQVALDLGLKHTHFVESSGYSEENTTTAREMAAFCKVYLTQHPDSLKRFHSVTSFTYPKARNMAPGDTYGPQDFSQGLPRHITMGITQKNTNPMLGLYEGCDGLKTGYIDESGYNLSLTAERNGTRFLSVTMRGPGNNTSEGQQWRIKDGTKLMDFAFGSFADLPLDSGLHVFDVKVYGSKEKMIKLFPAYESKAICVPFVYGSSMQENLDNVNISCDYPEKLKGEIKAGQVCGSIKITLAGYTLQTIPLVADRTTTKENFFIRFVDSFID